MTRRALERVSRDGIVRALREEIRQARLTEAHNAWREAGTYINGLHSAITIVQNFRPRKRKKVKT